jgi:hypothetical protein
LGVSTLNVMVGALSVTMQPGILAEKNTLALGIPAVSNTFMPVKEMPAILLENDVDGPAQENDTVGHREATDAFTAI